MAALLEHRAFLGNILEKQALRRKTIDENYDFPPLTSISGNTTSSSAGPSSTSKGKSKDNVVNYISEEETVRNDYTKWYGVSGEWGSNYILGSGDNEICEEYPALRKLMDLKAQLVDSTSHPPLYHQLPISPPSNPDSTVQTSTYSENLTSLLSPNRFDVILITPSSSWDETLNLPIRNISADPGFVFLWVGSSGGDDGLERGRECFAKWGFRRAEDIVWVKSNYSKIGEGETKGLLGSQKEHCLMGIRGTVRRSTDMRFVHCNVDTDIMVWEGDSSDPESPHYPPYLQSLIENFCLGTRRLHIHGSPRTARRGWVTIGSQPLSSPSNPSPETSQAELTVQPFGPNLYPSQVFYAPEDNRPTLPFNPEVDSLRPKSPQRKGRNLPTSQGQGQGQGQVQVHGIPSRPHTGQPPSTGSGGGQNSFRPPRYQQQQQQQQQQAQQQAAMQRQIQAHMMAQMQMQALQAQMQAGMMFNPSGAGQMQMQMPMQGMQMSPGMGMSGMQGMGGMGMMPGHGMPMQQQQMGMGGQGMMYPGQRQQGMMMGYPQASGPGHWQNSGQQFDYGNSPQQQYDEMGNPIWQNSPGQWQ